MRKWAVVVVLLVLVGVASSAATAWIVRDDSDVPRASAESDSSELQGEIQNLKVLWNIQLEHLHPAEPVGRVGGAGPETGLYLARIVSVDPSSTAITFDWLGRSPLDDSTINRDATTQTMQGMGLSPIFVQVPANPDLSGFQAGATVPVGPDVTEFFATLRSNEASAAEWLESAWWVQTEGSDSYSGLMQATIPVGSK